MFIYIHTLKWGSAAWSSQVPPANVTSWDTVHCLLNIFKKTVWIVNVCSTQNNPNTKIVFIQLMNSKRFLVRSSTNHKHNDILWPVITAYLLTCTISQTELVHKQKFFKGSFTTSHIYIWTMRHWTGSDLELWLQNITIRPVSLGHPSILDINNPDNFHNLSVSASVCACMSVWQ